MKIYRNLLFCILLTACATRKNDFHKILSIDNLAEQKFGINIHRDTVLLTKSGCIIRIPKDAIKSQMDNVHLIVKEAITSADMIISGLTTSNSGRQLSSGGMIFIDVEKGKDVSIEGVIEVKVPTEQYNPNMQMYKGVEQDGAINWEPLDSLPNAGLQQRVKIGEQLFKSNCANCHKGEDDFTGPALAGITNRRSKNWLHNFINNPSAMNDSISLNLKRKWKPTIMPRFPLLKAHEIDDILAYITVNSNQDKVKNEFLKTLGDVDTLCRDSCLSYFIAKNNMQNFKEELEKMDRENEEFFTLEETIPIVSEPQEIFADNANTNAVDNVEKVQPKNITSTFYTINIKAFGWYNIDVLVEKLDVHPCEIKLNVVGESNVEWNVALVIPSHRIFTEGGRLKKSSSYGFYYDNGKVDMPLNTKAIVLAFGEANGNLYFGSMDFFTKLENNLEIVIQKIGKEELPLRVARLNLSDVRFNVEINKKQQNEILFREKFNETERQKPRNCDCGFDESPLLSDSLVPFTISKN